MKKYSKPVYVAVVALLAAMLAASVFADSFCNWITPPVVLFVGLVFALVFGEAYPKFNKKMSKYLLQASVVGLGFGMNVDAALASGKEGMAFTIVSVVGTMLIGCLLAWKCFKLDKNTGYLISSGTAICGGSAIAAVGPIVKAREDQMSVALGTVFILNAIALFIFPPIGHFLGLNDHQFGTWAAIAIHDTSSVVGAGAAFSEEACNVATTIKLTRALWIIPLALVTIPLFKSKDKKVTVPWFIFMFIAAILLNTYVMGRCETTMAISSVVYTVARKVLTLVMFFIGAGLSMKVIKSVGLKTLLFGVTLWVVISVATLCYVLFV